MGVNQSIKNPILVPISSPREIEHVTLLGSCQGKDDCNGDCSSCYLSLVLFAFSGLNSHPPSTLAKAISLQGRVQSTIKQ